MTNRNDLPPPSAGNFPQRVRETLMTYLGKQGNPLDRGLTLRDLIENGIIKLAKGWRPGGDVPLLEPGDAVAQSDEPDLTPPPTPTGFAVSAAISHVFIEHDQPAYLMGHGHLRTRLYGVTHTAGQPLPTFNNAVELGQFSGTIWALASNPATTWRLWIKWETNDGVLSVAPAGGTNGLEAVTGQDVATLLAALTGEITESQLYQSLAERINLVDGNGAGSVNARLLAEANARGAAILAEQTARQGADTSLASQITTLTAAVNTADANLAAAIQTEATARANADTAEAQARQTLAATVNSNTAAIQTEQTARASETGQLFARYTVKIDVNGYVAGFGLASTANGATPTSAFAIRSDSFYIASPEGPGVAPAMPFIVRTTPVTINGVNVPVGVYMSDAFIQNGTITNAKIANLAVDDAKIASLTASKITAGSITAGQYIQSANFISGTQGWYIGGNGAAEFGAASIRGQLTASQIDTRGLSIKDLNGNVILAAGTPLAASNVSGLGTLATKDTVNASTEVTGLGALATQNSVNWDTQLTNVPAFGNFAYLSSITSANISTYIASGAIGEAYIANAAITSAKIGDAQITAAKIGNAEVETLKIAGNAVTVPAFARLTSPINWSGYVGVGTIVSATVNTAGNPIVVVYTVEYSITNATSASASYPLEVRVGGNVLRTITLFKPSGSGTSGFFQGTTFIANPPTGDVTVALVLNINAVINNTITFYAPTASVGLGSTGTYFYTLGTKR